MKYLIIPLEYNCHAFLGRDELYIKKSDFQGMVIGSIVRDVSRYTTVKYARKTGNKYYRPNAVDGKIDRKKFECEVKLYINPNFADTINKITEASVVAVNNTIKVWIRDEFILYIAQQRQQFPERTTKQHIYNFCADFGLMVNDTFFESLKKFEYRKRKKNERN